MEQDIYYLNSLDEVGKLQDRIDINSAPIFVLDALKNLEQKFNKENLIEYFHMLDAWEEMVQDDYIGDIYEVIHESPDKIVVEFSEAGNPTHKDICSYFLA